MTRIFFTLAALLMLATVSFAQTPQQGVCGTTIADQQLMDELMPAGELVPVASERSAVQYVPIHFHLVADSDGNGRHKITRALDQLCDLNAAYEPNDMRYFLRPHPTYGLFDKSINSDNVYSNQSNTFTMNNRRLNNAVNVYVTNIADSGNPNPIGIVLAYYSPTNDWVVSRKDQINGTGNGTIPHEVGHFFSLRHTFFGWESAPFQPGSAGWPIAPSVSPGGIPTEKMDGSNCTTAGDYICDTPPDYNFGLLVSNCQYNGGAKDPMGVLVDPMENNYMGYFSDCDYEFTPGQFSQVTTNLNSASRNYLDNTFTPAAETIVTPEELLTLPAVGDTVDFYNTVYFEWQSVAGATYYLFELDINSTYTSPLSQEIVSTGTSLTLTNLQANRTYYWRVRPFNEYYTCNGAKQRTFRTPGVSGTDNIAGLAGWVVAPNPLTAGQTARVAVKADQAFDANMTVYDLAGRTVYQQTGLQFPAGDSTLQLALDNAPNGMYYIVLENANGRAARKLIISR